MSNLPAPIDPNLLPAVQHGLRMPYGQDIFLADMGLEALASADFLSAVPADFALELKLHGDAIQAITEGGTPLGVLTGHEGLQILRRLLEAGKRLVGKFQPPGTVGVWLQDL